VTPATEVMSTTAMIPETTVMLEEAGTQSAAHELCGDSQKNLQNGNNS
jgi:hypothetical protein